jgi:hypothetical protein
MEKTMQLKNLIKILSLAMLLACSANTAFSSSKVVVLDSTTGNEEQLKKHRQTMVDCVSRGDLKAAITESKAYDELLGEKDEPISIMNKFYYQIVEVALLKDSLDSFIKDFNTLFMSIRPNDAESLLEANRMLIKVLRENGMETDAHNLFQNAIVECTKHPVLMAELFNVFADKGF